MTQEEITESNKLIAKFMGCDSHFSESSGCIVYNFSDNHETIFLSIQRARYHTEWNWLMPVIEKIARIPIEWENSENDTDTYYPRTFGMVDPQTGYFMVRINSQYLYAAPTLI